MNAQPNPNTPAATMSSMLSVSDVINQALEQELTSEEREAERQAYRAHLPVPPAVKARIKEIRTRVLDELIAHTKAREEAEQEDSPPGTEGPTGTAAPDDDGTPGDPVVPFPATVGQMEGWYPAETAARSLRITQLQRPGKHADAIRHGAQTTRHRVGCQPPA